MKLLSEHFTQSEFEFSPTAKELGIRNAMKPAHVINAIDLCVNVLEPVREHFGKPVTITSGFRGKALNDAVGGSTKSQHNEGMAADIKITGVPEKDVHAWIVGNLRFDQCILESSDTGASWVHVSYNRVRNRKQSLRGVRMDGKTTYSKL